MYLHKPLIDIIMYVTIITYMVFKLPIKYYLQT